MKGGILVSEQGEVKGVFDTESLANLVGQTIYNQGKAKIFNILEAAMPQNNQLAATKRVSQNILSSIAKDVADQLREVLGDWQQEVTAGGEVSPEDEKQARKEYEEIKQIIR
jgi:hypothetical protein